MAQQSVESIVYRDLEKLHRVLGYYEDQSIKPIEVHEQFIQKSLEAYLRPPDRYIRRLHYDLQITEAFCEGHQVFQADKPELSLTYALYNEGVFSLVVLRDLSSIEMNEWCSLVRETLREFDAGGDDDLASVLWQNPFRNLRTRIYNSLFDLLGNDTSPKQNVPEKASWHSRDQDWTLPEAKDLERIDQDKISEESFESAKQQLKSIEKISSTPKEFQLQRTELELLAEEFSGFDQNQVQFNLLNLSLAASKSFQNSETQGRDEIYNCVNELCKSILGRFQPSMTLFLIEQVESLDENIFADLKSQVSQSIEDCLKRPENEKKLMSALQDKERASVARRLFPFLSESQFPAIIDFYIAEQDRDGLVDFLKHILQRSLPHEKVFFSFGEERLVKILPLFRRLEWNEKYKFMERAIRSPYPELSKMASYYLPNVNMEYRSAIDLYSKLADEVREIWLRAFLDQDVRPHWKNFIVAAFQTGVWQKVDSSLLKERQMSAWVELLFKYLGEASFAVLDPYVISRRYFFFPKTPIAREIILCTVLNRKFPFYEQAKKRWWTGEKACRFQSPRLKTLLRGR